MKSLKRGISGSHGGREPRGTLILTNAMIASTHVAGLLERSSWSAFAEESQEDSIAQQAEPVLQMVMRIKVHCCNSGLEVANIVLVCQRNILGY